MAETKYKSNKKEEEIDSIDDDELN